MPTHTEIATDPEKSERAAVSGPVVAFQEAIRPCPVCGQTMTGRQRSACSDRCRAAKSRRKRIPLLVDEDKVIRAKLRSAMEAVGEALTTLERYGTW